MDEINWRERFLAVVSAAIDGHCEAIERIEEYPQDYDYDEPGSAERLVTEKRLQMVEWTRWLDEALTEARA